MLIFFNKTLFFYEKVQNIDYGLIKGTDYEYEHKQRD